MSTVYCKCRGRLKCISCNSLVSRIRVMGLKQKNEFATNRAQHKTFIEFSSAVPIYKRK